jgi:hypothetical protein
MYYYKSQIKKAATSAGKPFPPTGWCGLRQEEFKVVVKDKCAGKKINTSTRKEDGFVMNGVALNAPASVNPSILYSVMGVLGGKEQVWAQLMKS